MNTKTNSSASSREKKRVRHCIGMILQTLDIGCGPNKKLDVNIDLNRGFRPDIVCDAQHLPFKSEVFSLINCSHLLEHLEKPYLCLNEINRISKKKAKILVGFPLESNASNTACYFRMLIFNLFMPSLPFAISEIIRDLKEIRNKSYIVYYRWIITPEYVSKFLKIEKSEIRGSYWQSLLVGRKAKLLELNQCTQKNRTSPFLSAYLLITSP